MSRFDVSLVVSLYGCFVFLLAWICGFAAGRKRRVAGVDRFFRWDGRRFDARHPFHCLDQCRECGFKVSAPAYAIGQACPSCGEVARLEGDGL